jgi:hypothetical protein
MEHGARSKGHGASSKGLGAWGKEQKHFVNLRALVSSWQNGILFILGSAYGN